MSSQSDAKRTFFAAVAAMAEDLRKEIKRLSPEERTRYVNLVSVESDVLFAVWPEPNEAGGFGFHLIKGRRHLPTIASSTTSNNINIAAIPCVGFDQAVAAEAIWGESDTPTSHASKAVHSKQPRIRSSTSRTPTRAER